MTMRIILASASPRRQELLGLLKIKFDVMISEVDENINECDPHELVRKLAFLKASAVAEKIAEPSIIIGSDTIVYCNNEILGKPHDEDDAYRMLRALSGKTHEVYTGLSVIKKFEGKEINRSKTVVTQVRFTELSDDEIFEYIQSGEPMDKAGAYAIQGLGSVFVESINGDYFSVIGLPVCSLNQILREFLK